MYVLNSEVDRNWFLYTGHKLSNKARKASDLIISKVTKLGKTLLDLFDGLLSIPLRYIGSKTWSLPGSILSIPLRLFNKLVKNKSFFNDTYGYHFSTQKRLEVQEAKNYLKYVSAIAAAYKNDAKWLEGLNAHFHQFSSNDTDDFRNIPGQLSVKDYCLFDRNTSLKISLITIDKELIICFGAKGSGSTELKDKADQQRLINQQESMSVTNILGYRHSLYDQAVRAVEVIQLSKYCEGKTVKLVGQSFGGCLASYVGIERKLPALCFNSLPLGAGLQYKLGSKKLSEAEKYVTHISIEKDPLTDLKIITVIDRLVSFLGFRTPGNFGKRFSIPSAYTSLWLTHSYVLGSLLKYLTGSERGNYNAESV